MLGQGLADLYRTFRCTVGKLVGQYSDSSRVSRLLQTPSRESKKLKLVQKKRVKAKVNVVASSQQEGRRSSALVSRCGSCPEQSSVVVDVWS